MESKNLFMSHCKYALAVENFGTTILLLIRIIRFSTHYGTHLRSANRVARKIARKTNNYSGTMRGN